MIPQASSARRRHSRSDPLSDTGQDLRKLAALGFAPGSWYLAWGQFMTETRIERTTFPRRSLLGLFIISCMGCSTYVSIKPTELPKLNDSFVAPARTSYGQLVAVRVAHVEAPDGKIVEVKGDFDVRITLRDHRELEITHPVRARLGSSGTALAIAGGNRAEVVIPLDDISTVEISQPDVGGSVVVGVLIGVGTSLGVFLIVVAAGV